MFTHTSVVQRLQHKQCQPKLFRSSFAYCVPPADEPGDTFMELPNNVIRLPSNAVGQQIWYGSDWSFIMMGQRRGIPGLVRANEQSVVRYGSSPEERTQALARNEEEELMLQPCVQFIDIDADEFVRIHKEALLLQETGVIKDPFRMLPPPADCTADQHAPSDQQNRDCHTPDDAPVYEQPASQSPRRTARMRYTCRCGAINVIHVNPLSFKQGAIFAKCAACHRKHLIKDNMNLVDTVVYNQHPAGQLLRFLQPDSGDIPTDHLRN